MAQGDHRKAAGVTAAIGALLRSARESAGLTQRELERASGVDQRRIAGYETGYRDMSVECLLRLVAALRADPSSLLPSPLPARRDDVRQALRRLSADPEGMTRAGLEVIISLARDDLRAALSAEGKAT